MWTVDPVLVESFEILKLWKSAFLAKRRVMSMVICTLGDEGRRAKGRIGCLRDRKVLRKHLAMVTWEGGLKEAPAQDEILCQPRITRHCYFSENGDMISMKEKKETCSMVWQFCLSDA
jgi:hypothetical protein